MAELQISWTSLWEHLLAEAVFASTNSFSHRNRRQSSSASAIILARTSWESYTNEFVEQRKLDLNIKKQSMERKVQSLFSALDLSVDSEPHRTSVRNIKIVNSIRNSIVHQKAQARTYSSRSTSFVAELTNLGFIKHDDRASLEELVLTPTIADWSIVCVANSILLFEKSRNGQFRPPAVVSRRLKKIVMPAAQRLKTGTKHDV